MTTNPPQTLPFSGLEEVYEKLAEAIDAVGPEQESLFLTRFALTLAHKTGDLEAARESLAIALKGLVKADPV